MPTVYLETSVVSYLVARPSKDPVTLSRQVVSTEWWRELRARGDWRIVVSEEVVVEASRGNPDAADRRLALIASLESLPSTPQVDIIAELLVARGIVPASTPSDAVHLAIACHFALDYLVTWNYKHLANRHIQRRLEALAKKYSFVVPAVATPDDHLGVVRDGDR